MRLPNDSNLIVCLNSATDWATPGRVDVVVGPQHGLDSDGLVVRHPTHEFHVSVDNGLGSTQARVTHGGVTVTRTIVQGALV